MTNNQLERSVETICQCRKGSMDDKQFRATVEYNIDLLIQAERQKRDEMVEEAEIQVPNMATPRPVLLFIFRRWRDD